LRHYARKRLALVFFTGKRQLATRLPELAVHQKFYTSFVGERTFISAQE
jgi:hypothetical protein